MKRNLFLTLFTSFCLGITSIAQPVISYNPTSFNVSVAGCNDSTTATLTIYNTGSDTLDFDMLDGEFGAYGQLGVAYHADRTTNSVYTLDLSTNAIVGPPIPMGAGAWRTVLRPNGKNLYVSHRTDDAV